MPLNKLLILLACVIVAAGLSVWLVTSVFTDLSIGTAVFLPAVVGAALALRLRGKNPK